MKVKDRYKYALHVPDGCFMRSLEGVSRRINADLYPWYFHLSQICIIKTF